MADKLSITQLKELQIFKDLPLKQQAMLEAYFENDRNKAKSILSAYHCSERSARTMAYELYQSPRIMEIIAMADGQDFLRVRFEAELERAIRNKRTTPQQIKALQLCAKVHGFIAPEPEDEDGRQKFAVGDVIVQDGTKYRIEAVEIE